MGLTTSIDTVIREGDINELNDRLKKPSFVERLADSHNRIFRWASSYGHLKIIDRLLEFPSVLNDADAEDNWALREAVKLSRHDIVEILLKCPKVLATLADDDNEILISAIESKNSKIVNLLLSVPAVLRNISCGGNKVMKSAIDNHMIKTIKTLIKIPSVFIDVNRYLDMTDSGSEGFIFNILLSACCEIRKWNSGMTGSSDSHLECPICYHDYLTNSGVVVLECNHIYHSTCFFEWCRRSRGSCIFRC